MDPPSLNEELKTETNINCFECIFNNMTEFFLYVPKKQNHQSNEEHKSPNDNNQINLDHFSSDSERNLSFILRDISNPSKIQASDIWKKVEKRGIEIDYESEQETMETVFHKCGIIFVKKMLLEFIEGIKTMKSNNKIKIGLITFIAIMNILLMIGLLQTVAVAPFALNLVFSIIILVIWTSVILMHILEIILLIKKTIIKSYSIRTLFLFVFLINESISIMYIIFVREVSPQTFSYSIILLVGYNVLWIIFLLIICLITVILIGLQVVLFLLYFIVFLPYQCCCSSSNDSSKVGDCQLPEQSSQLCPICYNMLETIEQKICKINCKSHHLFHEKCIGLWLLRSAICPLDRSTVTKVTI